MKLITALQNLEKASLEQKITRKRLEEAAFVVADYIAEKVGFPAKLPRGYELERCGMGAYHYLLLKKNGVYIAKEGTFLHGIYYCPRPPKDVLLQFAQDIANGLIDEIAKWLEARATETHSAANILQKTV